LARPLGWPGQLKLGCKQREDKNSRTSAFAQVRCNIKALLNRRRNIVRDVRHDPVAATRRHAVRRRLEAALRLVDAKGEGLSVWFTVLRHGLPRAA